MFHVSAKRSRASKGQLTTTQAEGTCHGQGKKGGEKGRGPPAWHPGKRTGTGRGKGEGKNAFREKKKRKGANLARGPRRISAWGKDVRQVDGKTHLSKKGKGSMFGKIKKKPPKKGGKGPKSRRGEKGEPRAFRRKGGRGPAKKKTKTCARGRGGGGKRATDQKGGQPPCAGVRGGGVGLRTGGKKASRVERKDTHLGEPGAGPRGKGRETEAGPREKGTKLKKKESARDWGGSVVDGKRPKLACRKSGKGGEGKGRQRTFPRGGGGKRKLRWGGGEQERGRMGLPIKRKPPRAPKKDVVGGGGGSRAGEKAVRKGKEGTLLWCSAEGRGVCLAWGKKRAGGRTD